MQIISHTNNSSACHAITIVATMVVIVDKSFQMSFDYAV